MGSDVEVKKSKNEIQKSGFLGTLNRVLKYSGIRLLSLFITVVIGVYLTIMIANMGGYVDQMMKAEIQERITMQIQMNPAVITSYSIHYTKLYDGPFWKPFTMDRSILSISCRNRSFWKRFLTMTAVMQSSNLLQ